MNKKNNLIEKSIEIDAPLSSVWRALTDPQYIKEYMYGTTVICDWKVGKPIVFTGTWEGKPYEDKGTILKLEIEKVLQYNYWSSFSGIPDIPENYTVVSFELKMLDNKTQLTLTQSHFPTQAMYEHSNSSNGWEEILNLVKKIVERTVITPEVHETHAE